jgi:hypothetical protein
LAGTFELVTMRSLWTAWRALPLEKQLGILVVPVLVAFLSTVAFPMVRDALEGSPAARIETRDLVLQNPDYPRGKQPAAQLEVVLHNVGERTAVLNRAVAEIEAYVHLDTCYLQGDLSIAKTFGIVLPRRPHEGQRVTSEPLRRQLAPDEAERLAFRFKLEPQYYTVDGERREAPMGGHEDKWVYRLRMRFKHDDGRTSEPTESMIVSLPTGPTSAQLWTREDVGNPGGLLPPASVRCMRENSRALKRFLAAPAQRTAELKALRGTLQ